MKKTQPIIILTSILFVFLLGNNLQTLDLNGENLSQPEDFENHIIIYPSSQTDYSADYLVENISQLLALPGITGEGTDNSPYTISNLNMNDENTDYGLIINNISVPIVISNLLISNTNKNGILINNCSNVSLVDVSMLSANFGYTGAITVVDSNLISLQIYSSETVLLSGSEFEMCRVQYFTTTNITNSTFTGRSDDIFIYEFEMFYCSDSIFYTEVKCYNGKTIEWVNNQNCGNWSWSRGCTFSHIDSIKIIKSSFTNFRRNGVSISNSGNILISDTYFTQIGINGNFWNTEWLKYDTNQYYIGWACTIDHNQNVTLESNKFSYNMYSISISNNQYVTLNHNRFDHIGRASIIEKNNENVVKTSNNMGPSFFHYPSTLHLIISLPISIAASIFIILVVIIQKQQRFKRQILKKGEFPNNHSSKNLIKNLGIRQYLKKKSGFNLIEKESNKIPESRKKIIFLFTIVNIVILILILGTTEVGEFSIKRQSWVYILYWIFFVLNYGVLNYLAKKRSNIFKQDRFQEQEIILKNSQFIKKISLYYQTLNLLSFLSLFLLKFIEMIQILIWSKGVIPYRQMHFTADLYLILAFVGMICPQFIFYLRSDRKVHPT